MAAPRFLRQQIEFGGLRLLYAVSVPPDHVRADLLPVIVFLHGAGEMGDDGFKQTRVGLGPWLERYPDRYPAVAIFPQCPRRLRWDGLILDAVLAALDQAVAELKGDADRIYLTGVSMGGFGSVRLAALHPERFAAVVPVCGGGESAAVAPVLKDLPMWVIHGAADDVVPVEYSRSLVEAIQREGGSRIRYSELPGVGHNSWDPAYSSPDLPDWLFAQRRSDRDRR